MPNQQRLHYNVIIACGAKHKNFNHDIKDDLHCSMRARRADLWVLWRDIDGRGLLKVRSWPLLIRVYAGRDMTEAAKLLLTVSHLAALSTITRTGWSQQVLKSRRHKIS